MIMTEAESEPSRAGVTGPGVAAASEDSRAELESDRRHGPSADAASEDSRAEPIRLLLVDDHALLRESLAQRLDAEPDLTVVGTVSDASNGLEAAGRLRPHLVLMDIDMPGTSPFEAAKRIQSLAADAPRVVFLSAYCNDSYIEQAMRVEAAGYLIKSAAPSEVADSIRRIADGQRCFCHEVRHRLVDDGEIEPTESTTRLESLSPREREILMQLAKGFSKREIARTLQISVKTVAAHTGSLMKKLDIHDRVELARFAIREGLTEA